MTSCACCCLRVCPASCVSLALGGHLDNPSSCDTSAVRRRHAVKPRKHCQNRASKLLNNIRLFTLPVLRCSAVHEQLERAVTSDTVALSCTMVCLGDHAESLNTWTATVTRLKSLAVDSHSRRKCARQRRTKDSRASMACSVQRITVQHHFLYKRTSPDTLHFTVSFCKSKSGKIFATKRGPDGSCDEAATGGRIAVDLLDLRGHYSKHAIYIPVRRMP